MHEADAMDRSKRGRECDADGERVVEGERPFVSDPLRDGTSGDVLHHEPHHPTHLIDDERVKANDVRMIDAAECSGLGDDSAAPIEGVCGDVTHVEELHRHSAQRDAVVHLARKPHRREPSATELIDQLECPQPARLGGRCEELSEVASEDRHDARRG
jgi:hypothetical protein